jgi:chitinase
MMKSIFIGWLAARGAALFLAGAVALGLPAFAQAQDMTPREPVIAGYLPAWSATPETIAALPADALSHLLYAFGTVTEEGRAGLGDPCRDIGDCGTDHMDGGNFAALVALKDRHPHLQVLISLGGWTGSGHFSDAASTSEGRERLAASAVDLFMVTYGAVFDGIDIDWEYPVEGGLPENARRPEDRENFTLLIEEMRRQLDKVRGPPGPRPLLSIATTGSPWFMRNIDVKALAELVDWIGIMTYDYAAGASVTKFNSPLFPAIPGDPEAPGVSLSVEAYLGAGAPPDRLVLGLPFYGRVYRNVDPGPSGDGLFQPGEPEASHYWNADTITYRDLVAADPVSRGYQGHRHAIARVPWLYNPERRTWISYDDIDSLRDKAAFSRLRGLGGVMAWELAGDDGTLIEAVRGTLIDRSTESFE